MKAQQGFIGIGVLIAILVGLVVVGSGAYYVMHQKSSTQTSITNVRDVTTSTNTQVQATATPKTQSTSQIQAAPATASQTETAQGYFQLDKGKGPESGYFLATPKGVQGVQDNSIIRLSQPEETARAFGLDPTVPPPQCSWIVSATIEVNNLHPGGPIAPRKTYSADLVRIVSKLKPYSACI